MTKEEAIKLLLNEIDLWLSLYDRESEIYAELREAIKVLGKRDERCGNCI